MPNDPVALGVALLDAGAVRLKHCRHGFVLFNPRDIYVGRSFDLYGEFSELEAEIFRQIIKPGMTVLDIGANIGAHTIDLSRAVGVGGMVIAVEPQRILHQMLCANLALNRLDNVRTYQCGAGRGPGTAGVPRLDHTRENNFGGVALTNQGEVEPVAVIAIDSLDLPACHFMKIDVEGMEHEVLAGAAATIARHRPFLYVENDRRAKSAVLVEQIRRLGYRLYWHTPPLFNPGNFFHNPHNVFVGTVSINMLCLPQESGMPVSGAREVADAEDWPFA